MFDTSQEVIVSYIEFAQNNIFLNVMVKKKTHTCNYFLVCNILLPVVNYKLILFIHITKSEFSYSEKKYKS